MAKTKRKHPKKTVRALAQAEHDTTAIVATAKDVPVVSRVTAVSDLADQPPLVGIAAATMVVGLLLRRPALARSGARMLAAHALATAAKTVLKRGIDRTRPARAIDGGGHRLAKGQGGKDSGLDSFPSGHTAGAVAVAEALRRDMPSASVPVRLAAGTVGAMQLPRGKHYLSDVLAGAAIGWISERIASAAIDAAERTWRTRRTNRAGADAIAEAEAHPS